MFNFKYDVENPPGDGWSKEQEFTNFAKNLNSCVKNIFNTKKIFSPSYDNTDDSLRYYCEVQQEQEMQEMQENYFQ